MNIAILGRLPALSVAELERVYGADNVTYLNIYAAAVNTDNFDIDRLGGTVKYGTLVKELSTSSFRDVSNFIIHQWFDELKTASGKITLGISAYGFDRLEARDVQKIGLTLKGRLKKAGVSLRLVPNVAPELSSATAHHNKLGLSDSKIELIVVSIDKNKSIVVRSRGVQNISAYASRDQVRPKRDAFVGMLPPKLARMMVNLAIGDSDVRSLEHSLQGASGSPVAFGRPAAAVSEVRTSSSPIHLLDPFCGTGVILQEAALMGCRVYGTDINPKMIDHSRANLAWLERTHHLTIDSRLDVGDATRARWQPPIDAVACETYLGHPFSSLPPYPRIKKEMDVCAPIIEGFLANLSNQVQPGTFACLALPCWVETTGDQDTSIWLLQIKSPETYGFWVIDYKNVSKKDMFYYRAGQTVGREIVLLQKQ